MQSTSDPPAQAERRAQQQDESPVAHDVSSDLGRQLSVKSEDQARVGSAKAGGIAQDDTRRLIESLSENAQFLAVLVGLLEINALDGEAVARHENTVDNL